MLFHNEAVFMLDDRPMTLLFSETGRARFDEIVKPGLLCAFDFDGTLAPIVAHPEGAFLPPELKDRLIALSHYAPVAIITGRSVDDLRSRLGFKADFIIGNHGLEGLPGWDGRGERYLDICREWRERLNEALGLQGDGAGIWVEDKRYSLSVHYRMAADQRVAEQQLDSMFQELVPLPRVVAGKHVFNLLPEDTVHKGSALEQLLRATDANTALYIGDDVTDEDVFRLTRKDLLSVRVEAAPKSAAPYFIEHRQQVTQLLDELVARLRSMNARNWTAREAADTA